MRRIYSIMALAVVLMFGTGLWAQDGGAVQVKLSFANHKSTYRIGDPIGLQLSFTAEESGNELHESCLGDQVVVTPSEGIYPWRDESWTGSRKPECDFDSYHEMRIGSTETMEVHINERYRFDKPGHYTVHLVTERTGKVLTTNELSFDVVPMSEADEAREVERLESLTRSKDRGSSPQLYATELAWLTGDASTRAKLSVFLHPSDFNNVQISDGFWIARNRELIVSTLEQAMSDPNQPRNGFRLAAELKARIDSPYDPSAPKPVSTDAIERTYVQRIAATLPQRKGDNLVQTAMDLMSWFEDRHEVDTPAFQAAREAVITNFALVDDYQLDWFLNTYGKYLKDQRIIPALEERYRSLNHKGVFVGTRGIILGQLTVLEPDRLRPIVVAEICDDSSIELDVLSKAAPVDSLPEVDSCLRDRIHKYSDTGSKGDQYHLSDVNQLAARFATAAIYDDLFALYKSAGPSWPGETKGGLLAYFARYDDKRALPLIEAALPAEAPELDYDVCSRMLRSYYSPALNSFLGRRLESPHPGQAARAAYFMSEYGPAEDKNILQERLARWTAQWSSRLKDLPGEQAVLQSELISAVMNAKNWKLSDTETHALRKTCLSETCMGLFKIQ